MLSPLTFLFDTVLRQFILSKYPVIKQHNPDLPVLIREASGTPARVFARFGMCTSVCLVSVSTLFPCIHDISPPLPVFTEKGVEKHVELDNLSQADVESKVAQLLSV
jgi:hypothetical protein